MIFLILGIILFLVGIVCIFIDDTRPLGVGGIILGIILFGVSFIHTVPAGSTGIITTFGKIEDTTLDAGMHMMAPWKKIIKMSNRTQKGEAALSCFSSDIQEVNISFSINYQINKANAQEIYRTIGTDYFNHIISPKILSIVKAETAKYTASELISSREMLSFSIEENLRNELAGYNIEVVSTAIENIDFTDAFTDAVEAAQVATQNKIKAQTEQETLNLEAEAAANRQKVQAQADADAAIIAAKADAEIAAISADSAEYQGQKDAAIMSNIGKMLRDYPDLIKYYYSQNWDGKLPETMLGDKTNILYSLE